MDDRDPLEPDDDLDGDDLDEGDVDAPGRSGDGAAPPSDPPPAPPAPAPAPVEDLLNGLGDTLREPLRPLTDTILNLVGQPPRR